MRHILWGKRDLAIGISNSGSTNSNGLDIP